MLLANRAHGRCRSGLLLSCVLAILAALLPMGVVTPAHAANDNAVTIVKHEGEQSTAGAPIAGITFQLNRILDVDATSQEQVKQLVEQQPGILTSDPGHPLGPDVRITTDAQGQATATGLPDGVYLVRELPSRSGDIAWSVATPFLLVLPTQHGDPHPTVAVKDQPLSVAITASPSIVHPNEHVDITLTGAVPAPDIRGLLYRYVFVTHVDPRLVDLRASSVEIAGLAGSFTLDPSDWTSRIDPATGSSVIELTPSGLARLAAARIGHPDVHVVARLGATVAADATDGAQLELVTNLFTDGWPVPADLRLSTAMGAAASSRTVITIIAPPPPPPPAPSAWIDLAHTGFAVGAGSIVLAVLALAFGAWLVLSDRRHQEEERP